MLRKDTPTFLQNIDMIARQLVLLFKKSTTFWDNPRVFVKLSLKQKEKHPLVKFEDLGPLFNLFQL